MHCRSQIFLKLAFVSLLIYLGTSLNIATPGILRFYRDDASEQQQEQTPAPTILQPQKFTS